MLKPLKVSRQEFPESTRAAEGMKTIAPECDHYDLEYVGEVVYLERGSQKLRLQIVLPCERSEKLPLIVYIPGSAFFRQNVKAQIPNVSLLAAKGYAVALLEYRGSEDATFPSVVLDAKAGIAYMKKHAAEYSVDPERVFVMGDSSGGYAALMAGLTCGVASLEDDHCAGRDYSVSAVVDFFAPTDFTTMNDEPSTQDHTIPESPEGMFIGGRTVDPESEYVQSTIIRNYVADGRTLPPVTLFHGSADELVPFSQSCELYEALRAQGHEAELYRVTGAHHCDRAFWSGEVLALVDEFLKRISAR